MHGLRSILKNRSNITPKAASLSEHQMETVILSNNPYDNKIEVKIPQVTKKKRRKHRTFGLVLDICPHRGIPILSTIEQSTAGAQINKWRSTLRNGCIIGVNGIQLPDTITEPQEGMKFITDLLNKATQTEENTVLQMGLIEKIKNRGNNGTMVSCSSMASSFLRRSRRWIPGSSLNERTHFSRDSRSKGNCTWHDLEI